MPKPITHEDGTEETMYTQAELDAQLAEKDAHVDKKLKEFETGKTAQELKDIEREKAVADAKKIAEDAKALAEGTISSHRKSVVDFLAEQYVGTDKEMRTKLDDALKIVEAGRSANGLDIKEDSSIKEMLGQAAKLAGISSPQATPQFPMTGGEAPRFTPQAGEVSDADHKAFMAATGYVPETPPKKE